VNDVFHGYGKYYFSAGDRYEGQYENDMMHGRGTYTFKDGRTYTGEFGEGRFNGKGTYTYPNNSFFEGTFSNDQKNGVGIFTDCNGRRYREEWKMGNRVSRKALDSGGISDDTDSDLSATDISDTDGATSPIRRQVVTGRSKEDKKGGRKRQKRKKGSKIMFRKKSGTGSKKPAAV